MIMRLPPLSIDDNVLHPQMDEEDLDDLDDLMLCLEDEDEFESDIERETKRRRRWKHIRLNWNLHVAQLMHEDRFFKEYKMTLDSWNLLHNLLRPHIRRKREKSRSPQPITCNIIMGLGMRYLTGNHKSCIRHVFGVSITECHRCCMDFIKGVNTCPALNITMPTTPAEWDCVRREFRNKSKDGIMNGCVGCIDGLLQKTIAPRYTEVNNVRSYYSGHYEHYGLNCQGVCDARLRFLFFGVVGCGSMNDNIAYTLAGSLPEAIKNLPEGMFIVGDAAYSLSEKLLIPFTGSQAEVKENDTFNFYLSQVRIRIEMAFGLLVNRFRILKKPLEMSMVNNSRTIMACARLHNFIIEKEGLPIEMNDDDLGDPGENNDVTRPSYMLRNGVVDVDRVGNAIANIGEGHANTEGNFHQTGNNGNMAYEPTMLEEDFESFEGCSVARHVLVEYICDEGYRRPVENLLRNGRLPEEGDEENVRSAKGAFLHSESSIPIIETGFFHPV